MVKIRGAESHPIYFGTTPAIIAKAKKLRKNQTEAEIYLWEFLRKKQFHPFRFRRQHPISYLIVDFFSYKAMLAIEVDGKVHNDPYQAERDIERTRILDNLGIKVIRFTNDEIFSNIDDVLIQIIRCTT